MITGNKQTLNVYLGQTIIAELTLLDDQLHWYYNNSWLQSGYALSPHLPLQRNIPTLNVQRFLRNLLPEGSGFEQLLNNFHLSRHNTFGLIRALGLETQGALIILPPEQNFPKKTSYRIISNEELTQRLNTREQFNLIIWDGKPRLSVAGVQDKINVIENENQQIGFGEGGLCSTHILKFEKQTLSHLVLNEYLTMQLAKLCGLTVAAVKLARYGKHSALLVHRFDRQFISMSEVKRRHVIDGCQALNLPPDYKYERNFGNARDVAHIRDGASLPKLFEFANQCNNPALTKQHMLNWVLFNLLVFNYDAHGKNISFFVGAHGLSLAPFYDLVNIKMYPGFEQEMAMALGDEFDGNTVNAYQLADFADSCQLPRSLVAKNLKALIMTLTSVIQPEIQRLISQHGDAISYLNRYQTIVLARCKHLLDESSQITSIEI